MFEQCGHLAGIESIACEEAAVIFDECAVAYDSLVEIFIGDPLFDEEYGLVVFGVVFGGLGLGSGGEKKGEYPAIRDKLR